jgi:Tat protein translocase TatB subunit
MFDIGGGELLLIIVAVLILFGPKKMPEIARTLGKGLSHIRKIQSQFTSQMNVLQYEMEKDAQNDSNKEKSKVAPPLPDIQNEQKN